MLGIPIVLLVLSSSSSFFIFILDVSAGSFQGLLVRYAGLQVIHIVRVQLGYRISVLSRAGGVRCPRIFGVGLLELGSLHRR